jgi:hypothetical protein
MFHAAAGREEERLGAGGDRRRQAGAFLFHRTEECGELIEVVLTPLFVRMMVATRTFETRAEEELAEQRCQVGRLAAVAINDRGPIAMVHAFAQQDFPCELIVGFVLPETVAQPLVKREYTFHPHPVRVRSQQVGPLVSPVVGEPGLREEAVNEPDSCGVRIRRSRLEKALIIADC